MLVFIDESGDPGLKIDSGSSRYFTIALVVFEDSLEAIACDQSIELLKKQLNWSQDSEFHFKRNSDRIRRQFLQTTIKHDFLYYGVVLDKDLKKLQNYRLIDKNSIYQYACKLVCENI